MKITQSYSDITEWFFDTIKSLQKIKPTITIGLAGGTSFDEWYSEILQSTKHKAQSTNEEFFNRIRWCVTDERVNCLPQERNDVHIWEVFLSKLCEMGYSKEEYFIRPPKNPPSSFMNSIPPGQGGAVTDPSTFYFLLSTHIDIAFFGIGPDGHTASLFPRHPALQSQELGFIKIENAPKPPPERISLSPKSIQSLKHVCLFAVGESKKEAFANFLDDSVSINDCPARLLKPEIVYTSIKY